MEYEPIVVRFEALLDPTQADAVTQLLEAFGCNPRVWTTEVTE